MEFIIALIILAFVICLFTINKLIDENKEKALKLSNNSFKQEIDNLRKLIKDYRNEEKELIKSGNYEEANKITDTITKLYLEIETFRMSIKNNENIINRKAIKRENYFKSEQEKAIKSQLKK